MSTIRSDLIPAQGMMEVGKVLTHKAEKYGKDKWKEGVSWTEVLSSLKNHLTQFELGIDYNQDGDLNIAEVCSNALILASLYSVFPQGDDRVIAPVTKPIVAIDLDDVVFDFLGSYEKRFDTKLSSYWNGDYNMRDNLDILAKDKDFWVNLPVLNRPSFEVDYYVTARSIPIEWTQEAIQKNNLPKAKIYTLPWNVSKVETLKSLNVDIMIDDKLETFKECLNSGIFCYLMDAQHNRQCDVGHHRIYNLDLKIK